MNATVAVSQAVPPRVAAGSARRSRARVLRVLGALGLAALLLGYVFPRVAGTTVSDVSAAFSAVSLRDAALLAVLWAAGLFTHSFVLTGALPGLTRARALTLNLTGSAIANTLPFGGAAGMSMNYVMIRAWGVESGGFAAFTLVTNLWVLLLKLGMPVLAVAALWATGGPVSSAIRWTAIISVGAFALVLVVVAAALVSRRTAVRAAALTGSPVSTVARLFRRQVQPAQVAEAVLSCRDTVADVLRERWGQMSFGMAGYGLLQALLLWASLHAVGANLPPAVVLAGFAVDRVMTLAVITPGAMGFAEAGTAAVLVALGGSPGAVAAAVLLYRGFTFALEIPVGGTWLAAWLLRRRWLARPALAGDVPAEATEENVPTEAVA